MMEVTVALVLPILAMLVLVMVSERLIAALLVAVEFVGEMINGG